MPPLEHVQNELAERRHKENDLNITPVVFLRYELYNRSGIVEIQDELKLGE